MRRSSSVSSAITLAFVLAACGGGAARPVGPAPTTAAPAAQRLLVSIPDDPVAPLLSLAADAHHLAWTSAAGIVVADADGRSPRTLVPGVFAEWLAIDGDRLRFDDQHATGGPWEVPLAGGARAPVAADARGPRPPPEAGPDDDPVRVTDSRGAVTVAGYGVALIVTDAAGGLPRLLLPPPGSGGWVVRPPALLPDAVVAAETNGDGALRIWRVPRAPADAPVLLARSDGAPRELAAVAGAVYFVEDVVDDADDDVTAPPRDRLVRVDADGHRVELEASRTIVALAADERGVAYATTDDEARASIWLAEPGGPARRIVDGIDDELVGLALSPRSLYWIAGGTIWTASRTGGRPTRFHHPEWGDAGGNGTVHLVIDGSTVYFSSVGLGATGIFRTRGGFDATELWPPPDAGMTDDLVQVGGALFVVVGDSAIWRIPMDGAAPRELYRAGGHHRVLTIAGGGGWLYAAVAGEGLPEVLALDPVTGATGGDLPLFAEQLAADDGALYILDGTGAIIRAPHPRHPR